MTAIISRLALPKLADALDAAHETMSGLLPKLMPRRRQPQGRPGRATSG